MKILLINNLYGKYARGGAERVVQLVAEELARRGNEVVIISTRPWWTAHNAGDCRVTPLRSVPRNDSDALCIWNLISYYNLHKLPKILRPLWHIINIFNIQSYFKIKKILSAQGRSASGGQTEKPDMVMTHNLVGVGFLTPLAIKKIKRSNHSSGSDWISRVQHIHTLHDIQLLHPSGLMIAGEEGKVDGWFAKLYQLWTKKLFASVDVVVSPSRWLMDEHVKRGFFANAKRVVMANPVFFLDSGSRSARAPLGRNDNFIFLYVGQIERHKGVELLLEAFSELQRKDCELWIVGEKNKKIFNTKYSILNNTIKFLGKKNAQEVQERMRRANCLVVPSLCYENQPTVIMEAYAQGVPVIASDLGGMPELVPREFLFKAGSRETLAQKMQWVVSNYQNLNKTTQKVTSVREYVENIMKL